jgi:hypothetical protein
MLVENKFIYIALPRSASTSFYYSCLINNIDVNHLNENYYKNNSKIDFTKIKTDEIMNFIEHGHETLYDLKNKFGNSLPVIAVKRNKYDRFISLYKHILFDFQRIGLPHMYEHFAKLNVEDLFFFKTNEIVNKELRWEIINDYLIKNNLVKHRININLSNYENIKNESDYTSTRWYINNVLDLLITPTSYWHMYDKEIIWFDFEKLHEMEMWVSDKIGKPFKMKKLNSSNHMECKIKLNNKFIKKYDEVYEIYENPKKKLTLI